MTNFLNPLCQKQGINLFSGTERKKNLFCAFILMKQGSIHALGYDQAGNDATNLPHQNVLRVVTEIHDKTLLEIDDMNSSILQVYPTP